MHLGFRIKAGRMIRSVQCCKVTGLMRLATRIPLIERKAMLLREEAEQSPGMHKNNLFRAGQAASVSFSKFREHTVECLTRVHRV